MKKNTFLILFTFFTLSSIYGQSLYKRAWGTTKELIARPNIAEVHPVTGDLYVLFRNDFGNDYKNMHAASNLIYVYSRSNGSLSLFFTFPLPVKIVLPSGKPDLEGTSLIENFKFDNNGNLIITGRTYKKDLATTGAYSSQLITDVFTSSSFITKVSPSGQIIWFTYFHALVQNKEHLAIDPNNNIYVVSRRKKTDVLTGSNFQNTGDAASTAAIQNVISKLDANGKHQWSTFYVKDLSEITGIEAGTGGLYVYGNHFSSTAQSNYFGTKNSYQEYASGIMLWGQPTSTCNVFLSKFNFNGTRAWSTYFGNQISKNIYNDVSQNPKGLVVIDDDAYFIARHTNVNSLTPSLATNNAFLTTLPSQNHDPYTLTKVSSSGKLEWTTYLYSAQVLTKSFDGNSLHLSAAVENNHPNTAQMTNNQSYQSSLNGIKDVYSYSIPLDGTKITYSSFYGFDGEDFGYSLPTINGYYTIGIGYGYNSANTQFVTAGMEFDPFINYGKPAYYGNFLAYITTERVSTKNEKQDQNRVTIYPNPVLETLNIQTRDPLSEDTQISVFDVAGKRVLRTYAKATELNQLNVSSLNSGVYILQLSSSNINQSHKFIKK